MLNSLDNFFLLLGYGKKVEMFFAILFDKIKTEKKENSLQTFSLFQVLCKSSFVCCVDWLENERKRGIKYSGQWEKVLYCDFEKYNVIWKNCWA